MPYGDSRGTWKQTLAGNRGKLETVIRYAVVLFSPDLSYAATAGTLRAAGRACGAIQGDLPRIVTHADSKSAIDCRIRRQPYLLKALWISYP